MGAPRILVVDNYPAQSLPEDLRRGLGDEALVRVTVEAKDIEKAIPLTSFVGSAKGCYPKPEDAVDAIRGLRDEWQ